MRTIFFFIVFLLVGFLAKGQRIVQTINSSWNFNLDISASLDKTVNIPHTWNNIDAFSEKGKYYRGVGTYSKTIIIPNEWQDRKVFIKFEGANQITKMWVNEKLVGEHHGGYTGFVFDLTPSILFGKENSFRIEVDNRHNPNVPPLEADFNFYGGIYRDVYLITTNRLHFETDNEATGNLLISTPEVSAQEANIFIQSNVKNDNIYPVYCELKFKIFNPDGTLHQLISKRFELPKNQGKKIALNYSIENPLLWSPENPNLYRVEGELINSENGEIMDNISSDFGCRWFSIAPEKGFFLNGKYYKLIGVNRHQDYQGLGNALPNSLHEKDYKLIKEMGSNFVRIAHYPHDPDVYRMCDRLGLLVWSEIPVINDVTDSEEYTDACLSMQREQILQFYNHPSIIMWGYMNEIFIRTVFNRNLTKEQKENNIKVSVKLAKELEQETKKLDSLRYSVMALHNNQIYNSTGIADIPDIIGWNLYFGWYDKTLDDLGDFLDDQHNRYPDRPIIVSEYGPGSDIRIQTNSPKPWDYSEAYQVESHQSYFRQVMDRNFVLGMAAWSFADFGSQGRQDTKPFINQKGLVNFNRTTKNVYHYYQAMLKDVPFVYVAGKNQEIQYCPSNKTGKAEVEVTVFSNQEKVDLLVDGEFAKRLDIVDGIASIKFTLADGKHRIEARAKEIFHERSFTVRKRSELLSELDQNPLCINVGSHCDFHDPLSNETWIKDQPYSEAAWGYVGGIVYQRSKNKFQGSPFNIYGTECDPLFQTMREGIKAYRFDVGKGRYRITLLFAEHNRNAVEELVYNLNDETLLSNKELRVFSIRINGKVVKHHMNLSREYGSSRAVEISYEIETNRSVTVDFEEEYGLTLLSGIKIQQL